MSFKSQGKTDAVPPFASISALTSSKVSLVRATSNTWAPASAKRWAAVKPIPLEAPVINTVLPFTFS